MKVKIAKWGNSLGLRLPRAAVEAAGLKPGAEVDVTIEGRDLRVRSLLPVKFYRLEDLLAEMDRLGPYNEPETVGWGSDRGAEIIDDACTPGEIT
jgi:antitoxin MazE